MALGLAACASVPERTNAVEAALFNRKEDFRACFEKDKTVFMAAPIAGRVETEFSINEQGKVTKAAVRKSTLGRPATEACILTTIRSIQFPHNHGRVEVKYPFSYHN